MLFSRWACLAGIIFLFTMGCRQTPQTGSTDPAQNRFFNNYSVIYNKLGHIPADSIQLELNQYLAEFTENADAWMLAGTLAYNRADYPNATLYYSKAISLQPQNPIYYSALGATYNSQNLLDSAGFYLRKALSLQDTSAYTWLNLSLMAIKNHNKPAAMAAADSAFSRLPHSPVITSGLSYVYLLAGDTTLSRSYYNKAINNGLLDTTLFNTVLNGTLPLQNYYSKNYPY